MFTNSDIVFLSAQYSFSTNCISSTYLSELCLQYYTTCDFLYF